MSEKGQLLPLTGLWLNKTKDGDQYFSGSLGNVKITIFKNKFKKSDTHPDYVLYLSAKPKDKDDSGPRAETPKVSKDEF